MRFSLVTNWLSVVVLCGISQQKIEAQQALAARDVVRVESGALRGMLTNGVLVFLGVPYAAPPVGSLRWSAPRPAKNWEGVRDARKMPVPCAQGVPGTASVNTNEDCLYLNIAAPAEAAVHGLRPVMVWLHGGGFSAGTGNSYDPHRMVIAGDVIVVTIQFRLNIFGYFGYPGLKGSGTFGLQDQQAALRWVKGNIAAFGGDPGNITLFGESGGGIAACAQMTSPSAKGLFQKVILQSGAATTSWPRNSANLGPIGSFWRPLKGIEEAGVQFASKNGISRDAGSREAIKRLRELPASVLLAKSGEFASAAYGSRILPNHPAMALKKGHFHAVPVISGYTSNEGRGIASGMQLKAGGQPMTEGRYRELLLEAFGSRIPDVEAHYPRSGYGSPALAWSAIYTDRMFACPQMGAMRALAKRAPVYAYEFADPNSPGLIPFLPGFPSGASHSGELPFLFDLDNGPIDITSGKLIPLSSEQQSLAETMIRYWTQFARSGNPNAPGNPAWPAFTGNEEGTHVQFLSSGPGGVSPRSDAASKHQCGFWEKFHSVF
jgi:para-nitrobenzyl esterase